MNQITQSVKKDLRANVDPVFKAGAQRFFKEEVKVIGVRSPILKQIANHYYREVKDLSKADFFDLCAELWRSNYLEEAFVAINWLNRSTKKFDETDFPLFERWISQSVTNWATCDTFSTHAVGELVYLYPELCQRLKLWARSNNRWFRRAAAVTMIRPILNCRRHPQAHLTVLNQSFTICDLLLKDQDDLVQKGYGWLLKVASQVYLKEVYIYVLKNKNEMPRTALRYAIEKMPRSGKKELMG